MTDPYEILGVSRNATDAEIKAAYRLRVERFSSDNYSASPLSDVAGNKMEDLNGAYDQIMAERRLGGSQSARQQTHNSSAPYNADGGYTEIRNLINTNRIDEAESLLLRIAQSRRGAEWNFLMGSVYYAKGWLDEASRYFEAAVSMDPNNREYSAAMNNLNNRKRGGAPGNPYRGYNTTQTTRGCSGCDICTSLMCADCCCECMGGDLIRCC